MSGHVARLRTRHRRNVVLLVRFGLVGLSGVVVNMVTLILLRKLGPPFESAVVGLLGSEFHLRWYHVYSTAAFFVANLSNFQLNRSYTFRSSRHARWWHEYGPFVAVGLAGPLLERGQVDGTGTAEGLLRHAANPREHPGTAGPHG